MDFTVRPAINSDLDFIMQVEKASFIAEIQEDSKVFAARIETCSELFLILQIDGKACGYLCAELMEKVPETAEELKLGHIPQKLKISYDYFVYISSFAILPEFRGGGSGKNLWQKSMEYFTAAGFTKFLLLVNESWFGAKHIYETSGFTTVSTFENFFPTQNENNFTDGILMRKNVN